MLIWPNYICYKTTITLLQLTTRKWRVIKHSNHSHSMQEKKRSKFLTGRIFQSWSTLGIAIHSGIHHIKINIWIIQHWLMLTSNSVPSSISRCQAQLNPLSAYVWCIFFHFHPTSRIYVFPFFTHHITQKHESYAIKG